jgi:membrane-associated phospholipid phosphatase
VLVLFTWTKHPDPASLLWGRFHAVTSMMALWLVYRLVPCRLTMLCRVALQLAMLSWWYPDTYDLNRIFPNLDHHFASLEQSVFGCQPALLFSEQWTSPLWSELMYLGYSSYFVLFVTVVLYYFFRRYQEFEYASFIVLGSFFLFYIVFVLLPVTGPQYYFLAAGLDNIRQGIFPNVGDYFMTHDEMMIMPGWQDGWFYQFMVHAHATGERPTAAFPSSHVGITVVLLLLAWRSGSRRLLCFVAVMLALMCLATVYIRAHYAIDVAAGLLVGIVFYFILQYFYLRKIGKK